MISYERYRNLLLHAADGIVSPLHGLSKTTAKQLEDCFFGYSGLYRTSSEPAHPDSHRPFLKLYYRFIEIHDTFRMLGDIRKYLHELRPTKRLIFTSLQLRFLSQAYVSEVYILRDRLLKYLDCIRSITDSRSSAADIETQTEPLARLAKTELFVWSSLRNEHVHEHRLTSPELHELVALEMIAKDTETPDARRRYRREFTKTKKEWLQFFDRTTARIGSVLDSYFLLLEPIVFDSGGKLRIFRMLQEPKN